MFCFQDIVNESAEIALAVGTESMSNAPFIIRGARFGVKFGQAPVLEDSMFTRADPADGRYETRMGITAENLATKYGISREECDTFALLSQTRWAEAQKGGKFKEEMIPLTIKVKGKEVVVDVDEHPRPDTSLEKLSKLAPAFKKDGVVTAGNASGINDGAGALVLASEDAVKAKGLGALSRVVAYAVVGCDPTIMGTMKKSTVFLTTNLTSFSSPQALVRCRRFASYWPKPASPWTRWTPSR